LTSAVESALRDGRLDLLELGPLTCAEASELLGPGIDPATGRTLFEESGGNPFYLEQLARAPVAGQARAAGIARAGAEPRTGTVPALVHASLTRELERVAAPARALLGGAAVAGEPFDPDVAAEIAGLQPHEVLDALDELLRADLLRATD